MNDIIGEAKASVALDGDTHSVQDFQNVAFWGLCEEHLKHAREKHPGFAKRMTSLPLAPPELGVSAMLGSLISRELPLTEGETVEHILREEVGEFIVELIRGDLTRAREEAADIVAVLLRALSGDIKPAGNEG